MVYFFYNLLSFLALFGVIPYHLYRSLSRGRRTAFAERFGFIPEGGVARVRGVGTIWVHAVSVGETLAVRPLLTALKERYPGKRLVVSNVTETGREMALKLKEPDLCIYFPFDFGFAVRRAVRLIAPDLVIVVETEIWPNFMKVVTDRGTPAVLVNGRISDRSFGRYSRLKWFFRPVLEKFSALCMQSAEDARRIVAIGAPAGRVHIANNLKFDLPVMPLSAAARNEHRDRYRIAPGIGVIVAGSTHQGEDEVVLAAYRALVAEGRDLFLVLVPRHPERAVDVAALLQREKIPFALRSRLDERNLPFSPGEVLLVDRVGELMSFYSLSDLVFVGGSLVPTGGHNILEPASVGVPVIFGPHMNNFREITSLALEAEAGIQVQEGSELMPVIGGLLDDTARRSLLGRNGLRLMERLGGSTDRHMDVIGRVLKEHEAREVRSEE
jgi:3-deoxy-D-manno-octulosonic-acid transferase